MNDRSELLATLLAAAGVFLALVAPLAVLVPSTVVAGAGLVARMFRGPPGHGAGR